MCVSPSPSSSSSSSSKIYILSKGEYELLFEHASLGFKVKNGEDNTVIVSMILDSENTDKMFVGDTIICINGVPLNKICDHKLLARKTRDVGRPLKVFLCEYPSCYSCFVFLLLLLLLLYILC
jgi:hypothetical protein